MTKYGLPKNVVYCSQCLMSNQRPFTINETTHTVDSKKNTLKINDNGICDACNYAKSKHNINWNDREKLLIKKLEKFKKNDGAYDCIVPGSGGKDSVRTAHMLKYKYGMNPLTITWAPHIYTDIGYRNIMNWINVGGFDNLAFTPNGKVIKKLSYEAFKNLLFPFQPFKFGIKFWAIKMALKLNIKLVMYGEPYLEYGSQKLNESTSASRDKKYYINDSDDIYLGGLHYEEIKKKYNFNDNDLYPYMPLRTDDFKDKDIQVDELGWYINWDPQETYYYAVDNCGFKPDDQRTDGTYGKYSSIDDKMDGLHFFTSLIKFGIGRTSVDASQEIRNGYITREEGIALWNKFEMEFPKRYFQDTLEYLNINEDEFWETVDEARPEHLWTKNNDVWILKNKPS